MDILWTVEKVKEELPDVTVKLPDGTIVNGFIRGRKEKFAVVWLEHRHVKFEYSWETIVHALNNDKPLSV